MTCAPHNAHSAAKGGCAGHIHKPPAVRVPTLRVGRPAAIRPTLRTPRVQEAR